MRNHPQKNDETQLDRNLQDWMNRHQVSPLHPHEKVELFEAAWSQSKKRNSIFQVHNLFRWLRHPSTSFAMGLIMGIILTVLTMSGQFDPVQTAQAQSDFQIERYGQVQVMRGHSINRIYSNIENPAISIETSHTTQSPKTVLHGTVQNGSIQVVWNLN